MKAFSLTAISFGLLLGVGAQLRAQQRVPRANPIVVNIPAGVRVPSAGPSNARGRLAGFRSTGPRVVFVPGDFVSPVVISDRAPLLATLTPGLGFDFAHSVAINRGFGVRALVDPITRLQLADARRFRQSALFGGFLFPSTYSPVQVVIPEQQPVVLLQGSESSAEPMETSRRPAHDSARERDQVSAPERATQAARPTEPVPELGEFILIRRDGALLFAVAYSAGKGRIVYVTREGLRRILPLEELDFEATTQINEQRGTAIRFPS